MFRLSLNDKELVAGKLNEKSFPDLHFPLLDDVEGSMRGIKVLVFFKKILQTITVKGVISACQINP